MESVVFQGLVERGIPPHIAAGFVRNWKDESGLDPNVNEKAPLVAGSRGGFGLAQWTGPRRVALEQYAQKVGAPVGSVETQLDYLMTELQGSEARAWDKIQRAKTADEAALAVLNHFERPAESHRARRAASYMGGQDWQGPTGNALTYGAPAQPQAPMQPPQANALAAPLQLNPMQTDPRLFRIGQRNALA